jgi:hypothetical protein
MELAYYYGKQMAKAARYYLGFLRYYVTTNSAYANMLLMPTTQTQVTGLNYSSGTTTNIYPSKEVAKASVITAAAGPVSLVAVFSTW